ncbi:MAG TPA: potassium transporter TrkG [Exilispira sp.]|nr:potassium transporter TrkG [Exilispira sp.]
MSSKKPIRFNYLFVYSTLYSIIFVFLFLAYRQQLTKYTKNIIFIINIFIILGVFNLEILRKKAFYTFKLFFKTGAKIYLYSFVLLISGWLFIIIGNRFSAETMLFYPFVLIVTQIEIFIYIFLFIKFYSQYVESTKLDAPHFVVIGFISLIIIGAFLLFEPISQKKEISFIDALFTSTSAVCVTGLTVNNITEAFTPAGLTIILLLIQLGGLGIMVLYASFILFFVGSLSIKGFDITIKSTEISAKYSSFQRTIFFILIYTIIIEFIGALLLTLRLSFLGFPLKTSLILGVFHSISAFCNAGFSLFTNSLVNFKGDILINLTIIGLITFGGIGFVVNYDILKNLLYKIKKEKKYVSLTVQSKMVLKMYLFLNLFGAILFFLMENKGVLKGLLPHEKVLASLFQVVTARTAGFNTVDISSLSTLSKTLLEILMIIGASSGSTGGGIKVTTFFIIIYTIVSFIREKENVNVYNHKISNYQIIKSFSLFFTYLFVILISYSLLLFFEKSNPQNLLFETISALGTVGLSTGITSSLSDPAKIILTVVMFIGRVGPLTVFTALSITKKHEPVDYPETEIMIG